MLFFSSFFEENLGLTAWSAWCRIRQYDCSGSPLSWYRVCFAAFPLEKRDSLPLNIQSGSANLIIFTSELSGYENSNCFSLMEIKTCLPCQLLNVGVAAGCGVKY